VYTDTKEAEGVLLVRLIMLTCNARFLLIILDVGAFFFWYSSAGPSNRFSVPHDRLFLDALERGLKREKMGQEPTTVVTGLFLFYTLF
jgi:hypothetical protein